MINPPHRFPAPTQARTFVKFDRSTIAGNLVCVLQRKTEDGHKAIAFEVGYEPGGFDANQVRDGLNKCISALEKALPEKNCQKNR